MIGLCIIEEVMWITFQLGRYIHTIQELMSLSSAKDHIEPVFLSESIKLGMTSLNPLLILEKI